jgi:hypothetical protein
VYTLSGSAGQPGDSFSTLLRSAYEDPVVEQFVVKLRYRFGS